MTSGDELVGDAALLFEKLPGDGTAITNPNLQAALGWTTDADIERYFAARNEVEDAGLIRRGRGRGGLVMRVVSESDGGATAEADTPSEVAESLSRERDLYEPLKQVIETEWARDRRIKPIAVETTADQGRRATGIWARPDLVSVEVRTFAHVPGKYLEVVTFEVKPTDAINVQAVYEALAHRRAATHAYVLLHVPEDAEPGLAPVLAEVAEVARGHGIGLIVVADPSDYGTWDEREVAARVEPDPARLDAFISQQLSEATRNAVTLAVR